MTFLRHTQPPPPSKNEQKILHFGNLANVRCKVHNLLKNTQLCFLSLFLSPLFGSLNPPEGTTLCYVAKVSLLCEIKWVSIWALAQGLSIAALQLQDAALSVSLENPRCYHRPDKPPAARHAFLSDFPTILLAGGAERMLVETGMEWRRPGAWGSEIIVCSTQYLLLPRPGQTLLSRHWPIHLRGRVSKPFPLAGRQFLTSWRHAGVSQCNM